ncbi:MAG: DEAD/DEAH box helicase [Actinomycetota bacterium]|nr:DEAD/DEAH box helicase [Actinomycetota bacterium]
MTSTAGEPFPLDPFQVRAIDALDAGRSVLVSAPTGSGKTVVGVHAVARALAAGKRAVYTTPSKALSNQQFGHLCRRFGAERVGLITGDASIRPHAAVVVATTEILRNMLFARSPVIDELGAVVLDEVHYLQDRARGSVWEEVIVVTPPAVQFACLSATVGNAEEFGAWLDSVRGATTTVVETVRPVVLDHHFLYARQGAEGVRELPLLVADGTNPDGRALDQHVRRTARHRIRTPRRIEVVDFLEHRALLPAIVFIFSSAACDGAALRCLEAGVRLTTPAERASIRELTEAAVAHLADDDLHAGMIPAFRELVERCFADGLVKLVYATETLALGIDMPARTVVIEKMTKRRGAASSPLDSGEYRQLTGRAGRRGRDREGHAVVLWSPGVSFTRTSEIVQAPPPDLTSAFVPTYNLAVNLVLAWTRDGAHALLGASYAQWNARPGTTALVDALDARLEVLAAFGMVAGWQVTPPGRIVADIYHERDLVLALVLERGVLDGCGPLEVAALASLLTYERRSGRGAPSGLALSAARVLGDRAARVEEIVGDVRVREHAAGVPLARSCEPGLAGAVLAWAGGAPLSAVLAGGVMAAGDLVRNLRQEVDLLAQIERVAADPPLAAAAGEAVALLRRGIVLDETAGAEASANPAPPPS